MKKLIFKFLIAVSIVFSTPSYAQDLLISGEENVLAAETGNELVKVFDRISFVKPDVSLNGMPSLFLTPSEQSLLQEARLGFTTRLPTDFEIQQAEQGNIPMGPRELALGGIVYLSSGDWTIWLNSEKITPKNLPPEILDIKVRKNSIKLKWFDAFTNQIFPIKLRTHQRFNIDTRIFLPGESKK